MDLERDKKEKPEEGQETKEIPHEKVPKVKSRPIHRRPVNWRLILTATVILAGLIFTGQKSWQILQSVRTKPTDVSKITLPKIDSAAVSSVRSKEPGEQNIDFTNQPVGRSNPFSNTGGANSTTGTTTTTTDTTNSTTTSDAAIVGTPTDNPLAQTSNEYSSGDTAPDLSPSNLTP